MIDPDRFHRRAERLNALSRERLGRRYRRAGAEIAAASRRMDHPRLARLHDPARLEAAFDDLTAYLRRIDPAERRRQAVLSVLAVIFVNLMLVGLALWAILRWRGLG